MNDISVLSLISDASVVVKVVMALLLALSLVGWALILGLMARLGQTARHDTAFLQWFWEQNNISASYHKLSDDSVGLESAFVAAYEAPSTDMAERKLRTHIGRDQARLESGLSTLASIGSVSPYIGLFGTVWGIMNAFMGLSDGNAATLSAVAPGIAEALIATAIGLFAAIPASLAFNHFSAKAAKIYDHRALFCDELLGHLRLRGQ